jgi:hypothetical protein
MFDNVSQLPKLGETFYGPNQTIDTNNYGSSVGLEGTEASFDDVDPSNRLVRRSNRRKRCAFVRNVSGLTLTSKRLVTWQADYRGKRVDGYARLTATNIAGVVDEHIGTQGVRNGDLFWLTVGGPTLIKTDLAGGANNLIPEGTVLVSLTAATSGATTAGRVAPQDLTGATAVLGAQIQNHVGRAMSAKTTANTNADILVDLEIYR